MVKTKRASRKEQAPKRKASSTHSSQSDSRPRKAAKQDDHNSDASGSEIAMINSRDLKTYRKRQRDQQQQQQQQHSAQPIPADEFTQPRGIRPPQGSGFRRRARLLPEPDPRVFEVEEEEAQEGFYTSYGGANEQERDRRISGWAGSVAGAGAGDPNVGVEYDEANVMSSSPNAYGVAHPEGEDEEDGKTEKEDTIPIFETDNAHTSAESSNRAVVPAQAPIQAPRRSTRVRRGTRVLTARLPDPLFDPVAHLSKSAAKILGPLYRFQKASIKGRNSGRHTLPGGWYHNDQETLAEFLDRTVPKNQRPSLESNKALLMATEGSRNSRVGDLLGASKQNAALKHFDRDDPANHKYTFASSRPSSMSENSSVSSRPNASDLGAFPDRDDFPFSFGGTHLSDGASNCAFSDCPCHRVTTSRFSEHYARSEYSETWIYRPKSASEYSSSPAPSPGEGESYYNRDFFQSEQHSVGYSSGRREDRDYFQLETFLLDYGSEPHEDRDYFPMQTYSLDYDGDAQMKEEPAFEPGGSAQEGDSANDNEDAGSAGGDVLPTTENNAGQQGSDDEDPEDGKEQDAGSENDDSSSSSSGDDDEGGEGDEESEEEMEIEEDDFCQATDTGSLQDDANQYAGINNTVIACTNHDMWGRIRRPSRQNRPSPPSRFPGAAFSRPPARQYTAPSTTYYATTSAAAIRAANKRHGYDVNGGIRPPPRPAVRPSKGLGLAERGGLPDSPFAGPRTRQNTVSRDEPLSPGQGYVSVSIAEQQAAQMLHALEGGEGDDGEAEGDHAEGDHAEGDHAEGDHAEGDHAEGDHAEGDHAEGDGTENIDGECDDAAGREDDKE